MLVGHLLCALLFGALIAVLSLWVGFSILGALTAFVIGANVGLGGSLQS